MKQIFDETQLLILVCQDGFVLVGKLKQIDDLHLLEIADAGVVREWGTDTGLGQLAKFGPQPNTIIDHQNDGYIRKEWINLTITTDGKAWEKWICEHCEWIAK